MTSAAKFISLVYIGLTALFLGFLGTTWAFFPADHMEKLGVAATGIPAINTLKSIMGTALLGVTGCCILFLVDRQTWYRPLLLLIGVMLIARVSSLAVDGFHTRMALYAGLEFLILLAVLAAVKFDNKN